MIDNMSSNMRMKHPPCKIRDIGLFIGLTTAPIGNENSFYEHVIKNNLFNTYKSAVYKNFAADIELTSNSFLTDSICSFPDRTNI